VSVDVFRGLTMAAMVIVNTPGDWSHVYAPLLHAEWHGWTPTDLIFPFFVFIVGVSIVLSKRSTGSALGIVRRAALLYALGLLLSLYPRFDFATVRLVGVLPRLAVCYLFAALFYRSVARLDDAGRVRAAVGGCLATLIAYWALLQFVAPPGGVAGDLSPSGNLGAWIDRTLIGEAHLWRQSRTWDPEGLLSTLPAVGTALSGIAAGVILTSSRGAPERMALLLAGGAAALVAGLGWDSRFPINKNLWTSSFVLFTSGAATLTLATCYWIVDVRGARRLMRPFVVMGVNALVLFVVSGLLVKTLVTIRVSEADGTAVTVYRWIFVHLFAPLASPKNASLLFALAALLILYALLEVMYRKRWFLRV